MMSMHFTLGCLSLVCWFGSIFLSGAYGTVVITVVVYTELSNMGIDGYIKKKKSY